MLDIKNLKVSTTGHDGKLLLDDISFSMTKGERIGLIGPSGAGKSLLATTIMHLYDDTLDVNGQILFEGKDLLKVSRSTLDTLRGQDIAIIFQNPEATFNPVKTIGVQLDEAIFVHRELPANTRKAILNDYIAQLQLGDIHNILDLFPHQLSGGQLQRLTVIMSIVNQPKLILADEITSALDEENSDIIIQFLDRYCRESLCGLIFISHHPKQMLAITERILLIENSRLQYDVSVRDASAIPEIDRYLHFALQRRNSSNTTVNFPIVEISNGYKSYEVGRLFDKQKIEVLSDISFSIHRGETVGIYGPSGGGKSTLAKVLTGVTMLDRGEMKVNGALISAVHKIGPRDVQIVFQDTYHTFNPKYTIGTLLKEVYHYYEMLYSGLDFLTVVRPLMDKFNLDMRLLAAYPRTLSGGQRQRFAIIQCLLVKPHCIILDESLSALDRYNQVQILDAIFQLKKEVALAAVIISHDKELVHYAADTVYSVGEGKLSLHA